MIYELFRQVTLVGVFKLFFKRFCTLLTVPKRLCHLQILFVCTLA